jgi:hypothetical protein
MRQNRIPIRIKVRFGWQPLRVSAGKASPSRRGDCSPVLRHYGVVANVDRISKAARVATTKHG